MTSEKYLPHEPTTSFEYSKSSENINIHNITYGQLNDFLDANPEKVSAFNRPYLKGTLAELYNLKISTIGISANGVLQGVGQLLIQRKGPIGVVQGVPARYTGPVVKPEILSQALLKIKDYLGYHGIGKIITDFPPSVSFDTTDIEKAGYKIKPATSRVINLRDENILTQSNEGMRRGIRKTLLDPKIEVKQPNEDEMSFLGKSLDESYGNQGSNQPYPSNMPAIVWVRHHSDPFVHLSLISYEHNPVGMMVTALGLDQVACSWMIGVDHAEIDRLGVNYPISGVLIKDAAEWAKGEGAYSLDLGEGPESVGEFKRRMGGIQLPYISVEYTHPLYKPLFNGRAGIKQLRGRNKL